MKDTLLNSSASTMAKAIREKTISSQELLETQLKRVEMINPKINAIVQLDVDCARQRAKELDQQLKKGHLQGPFHGVPFTAKDVYNTQGIVTTLGTLGLRNYVATQDATIIRRMKNAGAVLMGI